MNYNNKLLAPRSVSNGLIPLNDEGPRVVPLLLVFSEASILVDLENIQAAGGQGQIGQIQSIHIDNTLNAFPVVITVLVTGQRIVIPALSEAVRNLYCAMPAQILFSSTISSAEVRAELLNIPQAPYTYGPISVSTNAGALSGTFIDHSGTIAAGGVSQLMMAANAARKGLLIQNDPLSAELLYIDFTVAAVLSQPSVALAPGESFQPFNFVSTEAINVIAATLGHAFTAKELL